MTTIKKENTGDVTVKRGKYRVDLDYIGEGYCGDYDEDDKEDEPLMRFTVFFKGEDMIDASYCTLIPATTDIKTKKKLAEYILNECYGLDYVKKLCERLSHINPDWVK